VAGAGARNPWRPRTAAPSEIASSLGLPTGALTCYRQGQAFRLQLVINTITIGRQLQMESALAPTTVYGLSSILECLDLGRVFPKQQPLEVELGSGDGSFLVNWCKAHPEQNFLGIERLLGRIRKIERRGRRAGLSNLKVIRIESSYFLQHLLPERSCAAIHVYFPDPWPKRRHQKYRLINENFPALARRVLTPGGRVFLRTDNPPYFDQMLGVFAAAPFFAPVPTPPDLELLTTDFEAEFTAKGIPTLRAAYQLGCSS
jgi:tRNA (guanine-N7-)-methyltransferase